METVVSTGRTTRARHNGEWVDVQIVLRNGKVCACGPLHGKFSRCVGSASQDAAPAPRPRPRRDSPQARTAQEFFPLPKRRLPVAVPQADIDACDKCGPFEQAFYYCERHRRQAIRNVLLAGRKSGGVISLHLMMAENGYDICS